MQTTRGIHTVPMDDQPFGNRSGASRPKMPRRAFLQVGTLGLGGLTLGGLLRSRAHAAAAGLRSNKDTSIVWLWLQGGCAPH